MYKCVLSESGRKYYRISPEAEKLISAALYESLFNYNSVQLFKKKCLPLQWN